MAKLFILVTLVTMVILTQSLGIGDKVYGKLNFGKLNFAKFLSRRDPFNEPENPPPSTGSVIEDWITQRLDNFDPANNATWEQRYMMNGEHFQPGGCIFVFLAGEWTITEYRLENSLMEQISRDLECYMFYLEHRYYGQSRPTPDVSDDNLQYLTVDQALADTAHFIEYVKSSAVTPGAQESPVIVIGGHYSASLAAWFRQSYPHLAIGAWASSAPTLAVADHFQYKELSGAVYRHIGGNECYGTIERGFAEMEQMVADGRLEELADLFLLCNEIEDELDIGIFFSLISEFYSLLVQFDQIVNVAGVCQLLANGTDSDAVAVASILRYVLEDECINIDYEYVIEQERQTGWDAPAVAGGLRQYSYQTCTQFGWYHSSLSRFQPYGSSFPVEFVYQACEDVFGDSFSPESMLANIDRFNNLRGGLTPASTRVLYVHGQYDPWRSIGIQTTNNPRSPTIIIQGASQGNDLGPITEEDSDALEGAKSQIRDIISDWIRGDGENIPLKSV